MFFDDKTIKEKSIVISHKKVKSQDLPTINYESPRPLSTTNLRSSLSTKFPQRVSSYRCISPNKGPYTHRESKSEWESSLMEESEDMGRSKYLEGPVKKAMSVPNHLENKNNIVLTNSRSPPKVKSFETQVQLIKEVLVKESDFCDKFPHDPIEMDFQKFTNKRHYIAYEILTTEETYVRNLEIAIQLFKIPIQQAWDDGIVKYPKLKRLLILFRFMSDILGVNQELLKNLRERFQKWSDVQKIGDVILTLVPFLKMYREYTDFFDKVTEVVSKAVLRDKYFSAIIEAARTHPLTGTSKLESFLILPVQRIPRYVLLLTDLIKNTSSKHPDFKPLRLCLDQIKEVAEFINNAAKLHEGRQKCIEIEKLFNTVSSIQIIEAHRTFVLEGTLIKQCRKGRKLRGFFLFNDILLYGHPQQGKYILPTILNLESLQIEDIPDTHDEENDTNAFIIKSPSKSFIVYALSKEEKEMWITNLTCTINQQKDRINERKEIEKTAPPNNTRDILDNLDKCSLCKNKFTLMNRKHRCRKCGQIICGYCSNNNTRPLFSSKEVLVCDSCYSQGSPRV